MFKPKQHMMITISLSTYLLLKVVIVQDNSLINLHNHTRSDNGAKGAGRCGDGGRFGQDGQREPGRNRNNLDVRATGHLHFHQVARRQRYFVSFAVCLEQGWQKAVRRLRSKFYFGIITFGLTEVFFSVLLF